VFGDHQAQFDTSDADLAATASAQGLKEMEVSCKHINKYRFSWRTKFMFRMDD